VSLQAKVLSLKLEAAVASRHAAFWQKLIGEHGEEKAAAFYTHLGLNHLEKKSIDWEGLRLSREPKEHEKIAVKGIAGAQESAKEEVTGILLALRTHLISDGLKGIKKLKPSTYHELTLQVTLGIRESLRDRLIKIHRQGRLLVAAELGKKAGVDNEDEFDDLDTLTDLTDARVINDVQSRITAAATRFALLGLTGAALLSAIQDELNAGSVSYIDRASQGVANKVINIGRSDEAQSRKSEWERIEYSALLDANCCEICAAADGQESVDGSELDPAPNPDCLGSDLCRCFWVYIAEGAH
jgi:hypothetical protein